jgi:hypothetical protein
MGQVHSHLERDVERDVIEETRNALQFGTGRPSKAARTGNAPGENKRKAEEELREETKRLKIVDKLISDQLRTAQIRAERLGQRSKATAAGEAEKTRAAKADEAEKTRAAKAYEAEKTRAAKADEAEKARVAKADEAEKAAALVASNAALAIVDLQTARPRKEDEHPVSRNAAPQLQIEGGAATKPEKPNSQTVVNSMAQVTPGTINNYKIKGGTVNIGATTTAGTPQTPDEKKTDMVTTPDEKKRALGELLDASENKTSTAVAIYRLLGIPVSKGDLLWSVVCMVCSVVFGVVTHLIIKYMQDAKKNGLIPKEREHDANYMVAFVTAIAGYAPDLAYTVIGGNHDKTEKLSTFVRSAVKLTLFLATVIAYVYLIGILYTYEGDVIADFAYKAKDAAVYVAGGTVSAVHKVYETVNYYRPNRTIGANSTNSSEPDPTQTPTPAPAPAPTPAPTPTPTPTPAPAPVCLFYNADGAILEILRAFMGMDQEKFGIFKDLSAYVICNLKAQASKAAISSAFQCACASLASIKSPADIARRAGVAQSLSMVHILKLFGRPQLQQMSRVSSNDVDRRISFELNGKRAEFAIPTENDFRALQFFELLETPSILRHLCSNTSCDEHHVNAISGLVKQFRGVDIRSVGSTAIVRELIEGMLSQENFTKVFGASTQSQNLKVSEILKGNTIKCEGCESVTSKAMEAFSKFFAEYFVKNCPVHEGHKTTALKDKMDEFASEFNKMSIPKFGESHKTHKKHRTDDEKSEHERKKEHKRKKEDARSRRKQRDSEKAQCR